MCSLVQSVNIQPPDSTTLKAEWDTITVEYSQEPPGEKNFSFSSNVVSVVLAPQRSTWCLDGVSSTVVIPPGSICLYSVPQIWWQWEQPAKSLHVTLADSLLTKVATDFSISGKVDLEHRLVFTDPTILNISFMLKSEVENGGIAGKLYTESLANVLAIHLLRNYSEVVVPKARIALGVPALEQLKRPALAMTLA